MAGSESDRLKNQSAGKWASLRNYEKAQGFGSNKRRNPLAYSDGIQQIKKIELHRNLWRDPNQKQYLIDVYYNENSMNTFK